MYKTDFRCNVCYVCQQLEQFSVWGFELLDGLQWGIKFFAIECIKREHTSSIYNNRLW